MDRPIRKGNRVIVEFNIGEVEYIIDRINGENIYIEPIDGGDPPVIYFNGKDWTIDEHDEVNFRFESPDLVRQIGDPNVMINILAKMDYPSLIRICGTNQEINRICQLDELWRIKLWNDFRFNIPTDRPLRHIYSKIYNTEQTEDAANMAARKGQLEVLKWLNSLTPPIRPDGQGANWAAVNGHLHVLKWLNSLDPPIRPDNTGFQLALHRGHLNVLKWMTVVNIKMNFSQIEVNYAARNLHVLKWLNGLNPPILPNNIGANLAAGNGKMEVLKWLNSLNPPIRPDVEGANLAAEFGQSDVLEWLANLEHPILPDILGGQ